MRAEEGDAARHFLRARGGKLVRKILRAAWLVSEGERFLRAADIAVRLRGPRGERSGEIAAEPAQHEAVLYEHLRPCVHFAPRRRGIALEQQIPRAQGLFIRAQGGAVFRMDLGAEEIEIAPARLG